MFWTTLIGGAFLTFLPPTAGVIALQTAYAAYMFGMIIGGIAGVFIPQTREYIRENFGQWKAFVRAAVACFVLLATEHWYIGAGFILMNVILYVVALDQPGKTK